jgi:sulfonate transport system ATP-binding protein
MNAPAHTLTHQAGLQSSTGLAITLRGITKSYGSRRVLADVDLDIAPGSFTAIAGRSGSGKTTLLRLIAGLEAPDAGTITLDGMPPAKQKRAIRIMFQDGRLLPWRRVRDNVTLGLPRAVHGRATDALRAVGLADRAHEWPRVLSGGQKQRVALARALAAEPRLILLDEPLGALDALTRLDMQRRIERLWLQAGFTAILVTHDVTEAALMADRILVIDEGRIALDRANTLARPRHPGPELARIENEVLGEILGKEKPGANVPSPPDPPSTMRTRPH